MTISPPRLPFFWHNHHDHDLADRLRPAVEGFVSEYGELPRVVYVNPLDVPDLADLSEGVEIEGVQVIAAKFCPRGHFQMYPERNERGE